MNPPRRSLCIVSRDPLQCSELVLALQAGVEPDDEIEVIMDRRRERALFDTSVAPGEPQPDRRRNPDVDLAVRTKGFAIVPAAPRRREREETDPDADRARFGNILSFRRARQARPARVAGAAGAIMAALILTPPQSGPSDPVSGEERAPEMAPPHGAIPGPRAERLRRLETPAASSSAHTSGARPRTTQPDLLETYASRVEDATERIVSKAKQLFAGSSPSSAADPPSAKPRAGHAP